MHRIKPQYLFSQRDISMERLEIVAHRFDEVFIDLRRDIIFIEIRLKGRVIATRLGKKDVVFELPHISVGKDFLVFGERIHEAVDRGAAHLAVGTAAEFAVIGEVELNLFPGLVANDGQGQGIDHRIEHILAVGMDFIEIDFGPQIVARKTQHAFAVGIQHPAGPARNIANIRFIGAKRLVGGKKSVEYLRIDFENAVAHPGRRLHEPRKHVGRFFLVGPRGVRRLGIHRHVRIKREFVDVGVKPEIEVQTLPQTRRRIKHTALRNRRALRPGVFQRLAERLVRHEQTIFFPQIFGIDLGPGLDAHRRSILGFFYGFCHGFILFCAVIFFHGLARSLDRTGIAGLGHRTGLRKRTGLLTSRDGHRHARNRPHIKRKGFHLVTAPIQREAQASSKCPKISPAKRRGGRRVFAPVAPGTSCRASACFGAAVLLGPARALHTHGSRGYFATACLNTPRK